MIATATCHHGSSIDAYGGRTVDLTKTICSDLPYTGSSVWMPVVMGIAMILVALAIFYLTRRRAT